MRLWFYMYVSRLKIVLGFLIIVWYCHADHNHLRISNNTPFALSQCQFYPDNIDWLESIRRHNRSLIIMMYRSLSQESSFRHAMKGNGSRILKFLDLRYNAVMQHVDMCREKYGWKYVTGRSQDECVAVWRYQDQIDLFPYRPHPLTPKQLVKVLHLGLPPKKTMKKKKKKKEEAEAEKKEKATEQ